MLLFQAHITQNPYYEKSFNLDKAAGLSLGKTGDTGKDSMWQDLKRRREEEHAQEIRLKKQKVEMEKARHIQEEKDRKAREEEQLIREEAERKAKREEDERTKNELARRISLKLTGPMAGLKRGKTKPGMPDASSAKKDVTAIPLPKIKPKEVLPLPEFLARKLNSLKSQREAQQKMDAKDKIKDARKSLGSFLSVGEGKKTVPVLKEEKKVEKKEGKKEGKKEEKRKKEYRDSVFDPRTGKFKDEWKVNMSAEDRKLMEQTMKSLEADDERAKELKLLGIDPETTTIIIPRPPPPRACTNTKPTTSMASASVSGLYGIFYGDAQKDEKPEKPACIELPVPDIPIPPAVNPMTYLIGPPGVVMNVQLSTPEQLHAQSEAEALMRQQQEIQPQLSPEIYPEEMITEDEVALEEEQEPEELPLPIPEQSKVEEPKMVQPVKEPKFKVIQKIELTPSVQKELAKSMQNKSSLLKIDIAPAAADPQGPIIGPQPPPSELLDLPTPVSFAPQIHAAPIVQSPVEPKNSVMPDSVPGAQTPIVESVGLPNPNQILADDVQLKVESTQSQIVQLCDDTKDGSLHATVQAEHTDQQMEQLSSQQVAPPQIDVSVPVMPDVDVVPEAEQSQTADNDGISNYFCYFYI